MISEDDAPAMTGALFAIYITSYKKEKTKV